MYLKENDYECPYCSGQLEEDVKGNGERFRLCEACGKSFDVEEENNDY